MIYTAGIILLNSNNEMLITHPTNSSWHTWSIPKGLLEEHESVIEAAKRELFEETNFDLDAHKPVFISQGDNVPYKNKKKTLCPVYAKVFSDVSKVEYKCNSMVEPNGRKPFPENDKIEWVSIDRALKLIHPTQVQAFHQMILR